MSEIKWTLEKCYEVAIKYKTNKDFRENEQNCYAACVKHKYLKYFVWLERKSKTSGYWTKERCYEEAKKYNTIREFETTSMSACVIARRNGWMKDYVWLKRMNKPSGYWKDKDNIFDTAKKCKTKYEFAKKYPNAYEWANEYNLLIEMDWLKPNIVKLKYRYCIYAYVDEENKFVYVGLTNDKERRHKEHLTCSNEKGRKIISTPNKFFASINKELPLPIYLEEELNAEQAQIAEEKWVLFYKDKGYYILNKNKVGKGVGGLGGGVLMWTRERTFTESKKYTSRSEFKEKCNGGYRAAIKNNWIDLMYWLKPKQKPNGYWKNKKHIIEVAKLCEKRSHFKRKYPNAYEWAKYYNMLDELFGQR